MFWTQSALGSGSDLGKGGTPILGPCFSCCSRLEARNRQNQSSTGRAGRALSHRGRLGSQCTSLNSPAFSWVSVNCGRKGRGGVGGAGPPPLGRSLLQPPRTRCRPRTATAASLLCETLTRRLNLGPDPVPKTVMNVMVRRRPRTRAQTFRHVAVEAWLWAPVMSPTIFWSLDWRSRGGEGPGDRRACDSGPPLLVPQCPFTQRGLSPARSPSLSRPVPTDAAPLPGPPSASPQTVSLSRSPRAPPPFLSGPFTGPSSHQGIRG